MKVVVDGALLEAESARISPFDHGLLVGDGVFETLRVYDGVPFAWTRHAARLVRSAEGLGLAVPSEPDLRKAAASVVDANRVREGRVRITVTGGPSPLGSERGDAAPTWVVAASPMTPWPPTVDVVLVPWVRNERSAVAGLKTTSYAENVVALARAHDRGASEALFANTVGQLCEGTGSNVFVVLDGELHTPPVSSGCLAGITRALTVEWTGAKETDLPMDVLHSAEEIFLTSTLRDVQAVRRVDGRDTPGAPGPVTTKAMRVFEERAAADRDPKSL